VCEVLAQADACSLKYTLPRLVVVVHACIVVVVHVSGVGGGEGGWGRSCPGRLSRREFGFDVELYWITLRVESGTSMELQDLQVPVILLHELWHYLWKADEGRFRSNMLPCGQQGLQEFWRHALLHTWGQTHPALQGRSEAELATIIPASLLSQLAAWAWDLLCAWVERDSGARAGGGRGLSGQVGGGAGTPRWLGTWTAAKSTGTVNTTFGAPPASSLLV
jgi:hypothetical protein